MWKVGYRTVGAFDKVWTNVVSNRDRWFSGVVVIVVDAFVRHVGCTEADNDNVNVSFAARLAHPGKGAMAEMNLEVVTLEQVVPEQSNLFALRDGVR